MRRHLALELLIISNGNQIWNSLLNCTSQAVLQSPQDWQEMTLLQESQSWMKTSQVLSALKRPNWMFQELLKELKSKSAELMELMAKLAAQLELKHADLHKALA